MIVVNLQKAKDITHTVRRSARSKEFAPLDIKVSIPSEAVAAEVARQEIRERYAIIQTTIDSAQDVDELKTILDNLGE
jgi:hypothetical protein